MTDFEKYLDELLDGAKAKREYHGEAKNAYQDVVKSGTTFKRALPGKIYPRYTTYTDKLLQECTKKIDLCTITEEKNLFPLRIIGNCKPLSEPMPKAQAAQ